MLKLTLPLVENHSSLFGNCWLNDTILIACQHITVSNFALFQKFFREGLSVDNFILIGKSYSTDYDIRSDLTQMGIKTYCPHLNYSVGNFTESYSRTIENMWIDFISRDFYKTGTRLILLDDGGRLLESVPQVVKDKFFIIGIEQTTKGLSVIADADIHFPVIPVASTKIKREKESPYIASAILIGIQEEILLNDEAKVGVVGLGAIGSAVVNLLHQKNIIANTFDMNGSGSHSSLTDLVNDSDIIVFCTGRKTFSTVEGIRPGVKFFFSGSSEDVEFSDFIKNSSCRVERRDDGHYNLSFIDGNLKIYILKSGFPINFSNYEEREPIEEIQLTRLLIYSAVYAATMGFRGNDPVKVFNHYLAPHLSIQEFG